MLGTQLTPERKLQRVKITLLRNPKVALMSGILMVGKTYLTDAVPTAATNGRDERYNPKFVTQLKEKELAFVILHEAMHKMYRHLVTWKKLHDESHRLANAACDYVINLQLRDLDPTEVFIAMPKDPAGKLMGLIDERFRGMNAKQVFDLLKDECKRSGGGGGGSGDPDTDGEGGGSGNFDDHDWGDAQDMSAQDKEELEREIDQAIRQGVIADQKMNGNGAGGLARDIADLLAPKVDWREQLREFVKSACQGKDNSSWRRPNRRFIGADVYLPTLISERVNSIAVCVDTSGSIGGAELNGFMSELVGICEQVSPEVVDLLYWDCSVHHESYNGADASNIVSSTKPKGGGGTAPSCITTFMKAEGLKPDVAVVLTDGVVGSDWGNDWPCPVLWCITSPGIVAGNGKTIHIN